MADRLPQSLQESILALLLLDEGYGAAVAMVVEPRYFDDGIYRDLVERVLKYRQRYAKAPGRVHLDDVLSDLLTGDAGAPMRQLVGDLLKLSEGINPRFIADRTHEFMGNQMVKAGLFEAAEMFRADSDRAIPEIREILNKALSYQASPIHPGTWLNDERRALAFLDRRESMGMPLGIAQFDRLGIGVAPKEMTLYIGAKASGKTWFCVHVGKQGLLHRQNTVHISLEFDEVKVVGRYYQSLFGAAWQARYRRMEFQRDEKGLFIRMDPAESDTLVDLRDTREATARLTKMVKPWGVRLGRIIVKQFPTGSLTVAQFAAYLDMLENVHQFRPTLVIIDYPDLMKVDTRDFRLALGRMVAELRGIAVEREFGLVVPTQSNRSSLTARNVRADMVAEDITKINTADNVLTYSRTADERRLGLGRLRLAHARNVEDDMELILSQAYAIGQYCLDSIPASKSYWDQLERLSGDVPDAKTAAAAKEATEPERPLRRGKPKLTLVSDDDNDSEDSD